MIHSRYKAGVYKQAIALALIALLPLAGGALKAQGKFAGSVKSLIGKSYTRIGNVKSLQGWQFREGNVITPVDEPEMMTSAVYQKGTTCIVIFSYMEDTASHVFVIADVIEVKNVLKGWEVKTALCRQDKTENVEIAALVKLSDAEFMTNVKQAWRFSRDKKRVEALPVKGIDCMNEGQD